MTGLAYLQPALFTGTATVKDASGLRIIEAAGAAGEARLAARTVRGWKDAGATSIVILHRDADRELLSEVFAQYGLALQYPQPRMLASCGAMSLLKRAWTLTERNFPFREVTALWRNSYFRPAFEAELPLKSDLLLRQFNVTRGRDNYLREIRSWADEVAPAPLEDQSKELGARAELSKLAKRCRGFTSWFFNLWDSLPESGSPKAMVEACRTFVSGLGLGKEPLPMIDDAAAFEAFWQTLDARAAAAKRKSVTRAEFGKVLTDVIDTTPWPQTVPADAVRVLPPEQAVPCSHLLILGLGEGSFPRLGDDPEQYDEKLAAERAVFKLAIANASQELVLSYPALDAKGQSLLPSSFLADVVKMFELAPTTRQVMPLDGYFTEPAISAAEQRTQYAAALANGDPAITIPEATASHLKRVKMIAKARFGNGPSQYSGTLSYAPVLDAIATRFGPAKILSPTAIETYIACPFQFWMKNVLKLEAVREPAEEVDVTERGSTLHRMFARYHATKPHERPESQQDELEREWTQAVAESAERTASLPGKVLWGLERRRVQRSLNRYPQQWAKFRGEWAEAGIEPLPNRFETEFNLQLRIDDVDLRLYGTIDRLDLASLDDGLGYWIIDYKTGSSAFSPADVAKFEKLQLPLYALAVEEVVLKGMTARPLGFAYWLISKDGMKRMLPAGRKSREWAEDPELWPAYREQLKQVLAKVVRALRSGDFRLAPRSDKSCQYCDYHTVCRINQQRDSLIPLPLAE